VADVGDEQQIADRKPLAERTGLLAHKVGCLLLRAFEEGLAPLKLSARGYFVLAHIDRESPPSQQDLARRLIIDPTTMVALVDELERLGFVVRLRNPGDRRRYELHLTSAGSQALATADKAMDTIETEFFGSLSAQQQREFHDLLQQLLQGR
jgi:MarR family transcriptional regulator, lower aerobic nicotinate degradation pathway regulator